ncbi:hypothetical protein EVAR_87692_1 [Eumeta japonica]|uniref:Uncharacterized protein n=1 Tax=Eumeta variegata TaxID=151549 RepID=A0A4C1XNB5_EUMVA|nr:hypothetical protein EVAR_87692_1 [Eumeta japonica]
MFASSRRAIRYVADQILQVVDRDWYDRRGDSDAMRRPPAQTSVARALMCQTSPDENVLRYISTQCAQVSFGVLSLIWSFFFKPGLVVEQFRCDQELHTSWTKDGHDLPSPGEDPERFLLEDTHAEVRRQNR